MIKLIIIPEYIINYNNKKNYRRKETNNKNFWEPLLNNEDFKSSVEKLYCLNSGVGAIDFDEGVILAPNEEVDLETGEIIVNDK